MPYEYRAMTPEERRAVVAMRRLRGWPLHAPPHPMRGAGQYLITAANYEHRTIMAAPERRTNFEATLLDKLTEIHAEVFGWVVLANHYHILIGVSSLDAVSAALKKLHGTTSREWNVADDLTGRRQVWYHFSDRKIRNTQHFYRALNYIHFNPVKHGYVSSVYDWPWSSVQNYLDIQGRDWLREQWRQYEPDQMGEGWDDFELLSSPSSSPS